MTKFVLCCFSFILVCIAHSTVRAMHGPLVVSSNGHWFEYRDSGKSFFMAGVGGPEGFLFETDTRKQQIVDQLISSGANALYVHTIRSFEGDGFSFEDPYNTHEDINSGVNQAVLDNWRGYFDQLDANKIVTWIHILDDTARPWGCSVPLSAPAKSYIKTIVERYRDLDHLVWLSGEEFLMGRCTTEQDKALMSAIAAEIRIHDPVHPIGVHHNNGQAMQFGDDPVVNVFAQQICGSNNDRNPDGVHSRAAFGDWVYVMAECHPWHKDLIEASNRTDLRLSNWASAMGGGYVLMYDAYECPNKLCTRNRDESVKAVTPGHDPTPQMLDDLTRLHQFMTASGFNRLAPADNLATGDTQWVMANQNIDNYIAYAGNNPARIGVGGLVGTTSYTLSWFNPITGARLEELKLGSQSPYPKPAGFGREVALFISSESPTGGNRAPIANADNYQVDPGSTLTVVSQDGVLANDSDFEGDALAAELVTRTISGELSLNVDGGFTYKANTNFEGQDSFTYRAKDSSQASNDARVIIDVTSQPLITFWLVNAESNQRVQRISRNESINLNQLGFGQFSIEAVIGNVGSVRLAYSGIVSGNQTESQAPYAMFGDMNSNFSGEALRTGTLRVTGSAFSQPNAAGDLLAESTIDITFVDEVVSPPTNPPVDPDKEDGDFCFALKTENNNGATVCF